MKWMMPFIENNAPFVKHNLHLNTQTKLSLPKEQSVQKPPSHPLNLKDAKQPPQGRQAGMAAEAAAAMQRWPKGCTVLFPLHSPSGRCQVSALGAAAGPQTCRCTLHPHSPSASRADLPTGPNTRQRHGTSRSCSGRCWGQE